MSDRTFNAAHPHGGSGTVIRVKRTFDEILTLIGEHWRLGVIEARLHVDPAAPDIPTVMIDGAGISPLTICPACWAFSLNCEGRSVDRFVRILDEEPA